MANPDSESIESNNRIQSREMESRILNPESSTSSIEPNIEPSIEPTSNSKKRNYKLEQQANMKSSRPLSFLPTDCIELMYGCHVVNAFDCSIKRTNITVRQAVLAASTSSTSASIDTRCSPVDTTSVSTPCTHSGASTIIASTIIARSTICTYHGCIFTGTFAVIRSGTIKRSSNITSSSSTFDI